MKIQAGKIEITFTQEERDTINKFFGEIVEDIYSNDRIHLSPYEICDELYKHFYNGTPDSMFIE